MQTLRSSGIERQIISEFGGEILLVMPRKNRASILGCLGDLGIETTAVQIS
jgi:hypothetical protein